MSNAREDYSVAKSFAKGAGLVFIGLIIGRILGYLTRMVVARYLGPSDYGLLILALSIFSVASVIGLLGLQGGLFRFVPELKGGGRENKIKPFVMYSLKISLPASIIVTLIIVLLSDQISVYIFHNGRLSPVMQIIALSIPFSVATSVFLGLIMGLKHAKYRVYLDDLLKPLSRLIILLIAFLFGFGLIGASFAYFASLVVTFIIGIYLFKKLVAGQGGRLSRKEKADLISYSWPIVFSALVFVIMGQIDSMLLGVLMTASDVGLYNAALPTVDIMMMVHIAGVSIFLPVIAELYAKNRLKDVEKIYKKVAKWIVMGAFPLLIGFSLFSGQAITILFGVKYVEAGLSLAILSVGYMINMALYLGNDILNLLKKTKLSLYISVFAVSLNIVLDYFLIQAYGITGAAIATSITYSSLGIVISLFAHKHSGFSPYSSKMLRVIVSGALTFLVFYTLAVFIKITALAALALAAPILFVYIGFLVLFRCFDKEDLAVLAAIEGRTGIRIGIFRKMVKESAA